MLWLGLTGGMGPWKRVTDKQTGRQYYYNRVTKQTSWNLPARIPAAQLRPSVMPEDPHVRAAVSVGMVMVMHAVLRWERHKWRPPSESKCPNGVACTCVYFVA